MPHILDNCKVSILSTLAIFSLGMPTAIAIPIEKVPNPRQINRGWVTDMVNILTPETEAEINRLVSEIERKNGTEIVVVVVPDTIPEKTPKAFATKLFNYWGIGKKDINNGILFLVSFNEKRVEIDVGLGLENFMTSDKTLNLIKTHITPYYKRGNYDQGTLEGTKALTSYLLNYQPTLTNNRQDHDKSQYSRNLILVSIGIFIAGLFSGIMITKFKNKRN